MAGNRPDLTFRKTVAGSTAHNSATSFVRSKGTDVPILFMLNLSIQFFGELNDAGGRV
jgi:hypothetical protein